MSELGPDIAADVFAACQAGAQEAASAIGRAFDGQFEIAAAEPQPLELAALPDGLTGPGLVFVLKADSGAAVAALAESSGLVPDWCAAPDATGVSKLETLAQELGMVLLPEEHMPLGFQAARVEDLQAALQRGGASDGATSAPLSLTSNGKEGLLFLIWPIANPDDVIARAVEGRAAEPSSEASDTALAEEAQQAVSAAASPSTSLQSADAADAMHRLPPYTKSLLKIRVPVVVRLASTKQPVRRIIELGPGSIIQFAKRCDETLNLEIGGQDVAEGEAVKVGDKFGLRITSVILPEEKFIAVRGSREKRPG